MTTYVLCLRKKKVGKGEEVSYESIYKTEYISNYEWEHIGDSVYAVSFIYSFLIKSIKLCF